MAEPLRSNRSLEGESPHMETNKKSFASVYSRNKSVLTFRPDGEGEDGEHEATLTVATAAFNMANAVIGAGIVGLPAVVMSSGLYPFSVLIVLAAVTCYKSLDMLVAAGVLGGIKDLEALCNKTLGPASKYICGFFVIFYSYGACVAYLVLISNTAPVMTNLIPFLSEVTTFQLQLGITICIVWPLCLLKNLSALARFAMFSLFVYFCIALKVSTNVFLDDWYTRVGVVVDDDNVSWPACPESELTQFATNVPDLLSRFPTIVFAFVCHTMALPLFGELADGKAESMFKVHRIAIGFSFVLYFAVGICGYVNSGDNTFSAILLNTRHCVCTEFSEEACASPCAPGIENYVCADDDIVASILNIMFLFAVLTGFPTLHFAIRRSMITLAMGEEAEFSWPIHIGVGTANVVVCFLVAVAAGDVGIIFDWVGSVGGPTVAFIFPTLVYTRLSESTLRDTFLSLTVTQGKAILFFGVVMLVVSSTLQIMTLFE